MGIGFGALGTLFTLIFFGLYIILTILFIVLALKGIKALDIYIKKNNKYSYGSNQQNEQEE